MAPLPALLAAAFFGIALFAPKKRLPPALPVAPAPAAVAVAAPAGVVEPLWPGKIDPRAAGSGPEVRAALAAALGALGAPWASALAAEALIEEGDPAVRAALEAAIGAA